MRRRWRLRGSWARLGDDNGVPNRAVLISLVVCWLGCVPSPATQVLIEILADDAVIAQSDNLSVEVRSGVSSTTEQTRTLADLGNTYPRRLTLVPETPGAERVFEVTVTATRSLGGSATPVVTTRLPGRFRSGMTQRFTVRLSGDCIGVMCPMEFTCRAGICVDPSFVPDAGVDASTRDAPPPDVLQQSLDGGVDAQVADAFSCGCSNGLACDGLETCGSPGCVDGTPVVCTPRACETARCTEPRGLCELTARDVDRDGEGQAPCGLDCDDGNNAIGPGQTELCNGVDDNCDGRTDECPIATEVCRGGDCVTPRCGDGFVDSGEDCDPGPSSPSDNCSPSCTFDECEQPFDLDTVVADGSGWRRVTRSFNEPGFAGDFVPMCPSSGFNGNDRAVRLRALTSTMEMNAVRTSGGSASIDLLVWTGGCLGTLHTCARRGNAGDGPIRVEGLPVGETIYITLDSLGISDVPRTLSVRFL